MSNSRKRNSRQKRRDPPAHDFSKSTWDINDLRALHALTLPGEPEKMNRNDLIKELRKANIDPGKFTDHSIAAMRGALPRAPDNESSSGEDSESQPSASRTKSRSKRQRVPVNLDPQDSNLTALQNQIIELRSLLDTTIEAKTQSQGTSSNLIESKQEEQSARSKQIDKFANDHSISKLTVSKIADAKYTEIYETVQFSSHRSHNLVSSSPSNATNNITLLSTQKKQTIPSNFTEFSSSLSILMKARRLFVVKGWENDADYHDFIRDTAFNVFTPLGVFALDRNLRLQAARSLDPWWPIQNNALCMGIVVGLPHIKASFCKICGAIDHQSLVCPLADVLQDQTKKRDDLLRPPGPKPPPNQNPLCVKFMGPTGICKHRGCTFNHRCTYCKHSKGQHKKSCNRPIR